jgi:hypothetical protein
MGDEPIGSATATPRYVCDIPDADCAPEGAELVCSAPRPPETGPASEASLPEGAASLVRRFSGGPSAPATSGAGGGPSRAEGGTEGAPSATGATPRTDGAATPHRAEVNGCTCVPDLFPAACNDHDLDYQTCGMTKDEADAAFRARMLDSCGGGVAGALCELAANAYYLGVHLLGGAAYEAGQEECVPLVDGSQQDPDEGDSRCGF